VGREAGCGKRLDSECAGASCARGVHGIEPRGRAAQVERAGAHARRA
jgi:hypothetical protein